MMVKKIALLVLLIATHLNFTPSSFAQEECLEIPKEKIDTVVIVKEPVIIVKQYYLEKEKKSFTKPKHRIDLTVSPIKHDNIFNYDINNFFFSFYPSQIEFSTTPLTGYSFGMSYSYIVKNIVFNLGLSLNTYRDRFTDFNSNVFFIPTEYINKYTYLEPSLKLGYTFQIKRLSIVPYAGYIVGTMVSMSGKVIRTNGEEGVMDLKEAQLYTSSAESATGGLNILFRVSDHIEILVDPSYRIDTKSITRGYVPFSLRRQTLGVKLGVAYSF